MGVQALDVCSKCREDGLVNVVRYCSKKCVKKHWPVHKVYHEKKSAEMATGMPAPMSELSKKTRAHIEKQGKDGNAFFAPMMKGVQLEEQGKHREAACVPKDDQAEA